MLRLLIASAAALAGLVSAQNGTEGSGTYGTSPDGSLYVDPNSVDLSLRLSWCRGQQNNCPFICNGPDASIGDAYPNTCDADTLTYECVCKNGNEPNISNYMNTLPYYVCRRWRDDCTEAHPNDLVGQTECQSVTCGTLNATAASSSGSSSGSASGSASASASATPSSSSGSGSGSDSSDSSDSDSSSTPSSSSDAAQSSQTGNAAVALGTTYGTGILMGGLLAVFGLAL